MRYQDTQNLPLALSFDDVLLVPKYSPVKSRSDVDLSTKVSPNLTLDIPLIATNMDTITGVDMAIKMSELGGLAILPRFESVESQVQKVKKIVGEGQTAAASIGIKEGSMQRAKALVEAGATVLDIDVVHGHMQLTLDFTSKLKNEFKDITVLGGIAATGECADALFKAGADCVTVGVGGGSICSTRVQTGCGIPTFASLVDIENVARKHKKTFMPLAGIKSTGDMVKALAAGASAVRGGNFFAGTDECPGEIVMIEGKKYKKYNGSASEEEKVKQTKALNDTGKMYTKYVEGYSAYKLCKGPVEELVVRAMANLRSGYTYCGAKNLEELWENAEFVRITNAGISENGSHDVAFAKG